MLLEVTLMKPVEAGEGEICDLSRLRRDYSDYMDELQEKMENPELRSDLEGLYGVVIERFFLADVNFTEETRQALEAEKKRGYQMDGATALHDWKVIKAKELKTSLKLGAKDALDGADITVEQALSAEGQEPRVKKQIVSLGDVDVLRAARDLLR